MTDIKKKYKISDITESQLTDGGGESKRKDKVYTGGDDITRPLEYDKTSDDELYKVAKATYETAKDEKIKSLQNNAENKKKSLYESINGQNEIALNRTEKAENAFKRAESNLEDQTLRRGIQRSSAAIGGLKNLEKERLDTLSKIDSDKKEYIDKLNAEIIDLESDLGKEISAINEKYNNAVQTRLYELKKERDEKNAEITKYNNSLDLFYPDDYYQNDSENSSSDAEDFDVTKVKERFRERINEVLRDYTAFEDPAEALSLFETNDSVKHYLGKYYDYVHNLLKNYVAEN